MGVGRDAVRTHRLQVKRTGVPPSAATLKSPWCGGLAEWLGWRPLLARVLFVLVGALPFLSGILAYAVLWLVIPEER